MVSSPPSKELAHAAQHTLASQHACSVGWAGVVSRPAQAAQAASLIDLPSDIHLVPLLTGVCTCSPWCCCILQVQYTDGLPGDLSTAHPSLMPDGSLLNFTRSLPNGGFHLFKQDPQTLRRTEVGEGGCGGGDEGGR